MHKSRVVPKGPSEVAEWAVFYLFPFLPPICLMERMVYTRAAVRFLLEQVKILNLTAILTKDNADVYSPLKPLDKCAMPIIPALNPECYSRYYIPCKNISYILATAEPYSMSN